MSEQLVSNSPTETTAVLQKVVYPRFYLYARQLANYLFFPSIPRGNRYCLVRDKDSPLFITNPTPAERRQHKNRLLETEEKDGHWKGKVWGEKGEGEYNQ